MKRQVLAYVKPAKELRRGDRLLTGRTAVAEIESVEKFRDSSKRPCVAVVARGGGDIVSATNYLADEQVLVLE
ncbi:MAG: hypothetical protein FJ224_11310 [Lentisphaerae bacterium]|nr:hypothetical protein [Lentisphaerota bacterium]